MKTILKMALTGILLCHSTANAQRNVTRLFEHAADFEAHILSHKPVTGQRNMIRLNQVVYLPYVTLIEAGKKQRLQKSALYGYLTAEGQAFRFYDKSVYEIVSAGVGLVLYQQTLFTGGKAPQSLTSYFFSRNDSSAIEPLTKAALGKAYSDDVPFAERIYDAFSGDADLIKYDGYHKVYRLMKVYAQTHPLKQ